MSGGSIYSRWLKKCGIATLVLNHTLMRLSSLIDRSERPSISSHLQDEVIVYNQSAKQSAKIAGQL